MQDRSQNGQRRSVQPASSPAWQAPSNNLPLIQYPDPTSSPVWYRQESYNPPFPASPCIVSPSWCWPPSNLPSLPYSSSSTSSLSSPLVKFDFSMHHSPFNRLNPSPRSFEELHNEYTYLQSLLKAEDTKHAEFLHQIPLLESALLQPDLPERRKIKKQIGWYQHRLHETTRQVRAILGSLGQLDYEIQYRQRSSEIENERRYHLEAARQQNEILSQMADQNLGQMSLNPRSLVLNPRQPDLAMRAPMSWPPPISYPPYLTAPMYWPQQPSDYFGYQWAISQPEPPPENRVQPSFDCYPSSLPVNIDDSGLTSAKVSPKTLTGQAPKRPASSSQRSVSLNNAEEELDHMNTNNPYKLSPRLSAGKRASLPSLPACVKFWEFDYKERKAVLANREVVESGIEIERVWKGKGKDIERTDGKERKRSIISTVPEIGGLNLEKEITEALTDEGTEQEDLNILIGLAS